MTTKFEDEIIKEFEEKFLTPVTLWAQDENGKWYSKKDVSDFLLSALSKQREMLKEEVEKLEVKGIDTNVDLFIKRDDVLELLK